LPVRIKLNGNVDELALLKAGMSVSVTVDLRDKPSTKTP
jgi:multidrug resistance efflux pump